MYLKFDLLFSAAIELPGTILVLFLISRVSRLKILISANLLSAASLLLLIVMLNSRFTIFLTILGLAGMSLSFPTVYLYSSEVFPTVIRNIGIGLGSVCARTGSMIAPYIATMVIFFSSNILKFVFTYNLCV